MKVKTISRRTSQILMQDRRHQINKHSISINHIHTLSGKKYSLPLQGISHLKTDLNIDFESMSNRSSVVNVSMDVPSKKSKTGEIAIISNKLHGSTKIYLFL